MKRKGGEEEEKKEDAGKRFQRSVSTYVRSRAQLLKEHPSIILATPRLEAKTYESQSLIGKFGMLMDIRDAEGALQLLASSPGLMPSQTIQMVQLAVRRNVLEVVGRLCESSDELLELAIQEAMSYPAISNLTLTYLVSLWAERTEQTVNEAARELIRRLESAQHLDLVKVGKLAELAERGIESDQDKQEKEQREARLQYVPLELEGDMYDERRAVASLRYSADGNTLLVACLDRAVMFDMRTRKSVREVPLPVDARYDTSHGLYISPDLHTIVRLRCTSNPKEFMVYSMDSKEARIVTMPKYSARIATFSADGQLLAIGTGNKAIQIWRTRDWTCIHTIENAHPGILADLAFTCDGQRLVSARSIDYLGPVKVWRAPEWNLEREINWTTEYDDIPQDCKAASLLASPTDPRLVAFADKDEGPIALWDIVEGKQVFQLQDEADNEKIRLAFSGDGKLLLATTAKVGTWDAFDISIWETRTGRCLLESKRLPFQLEAFALSPSGFELVSGVNNGRELDTFNLSNSLSVISLDEVITKGLASAHAPTNAWGQFLSRGQYDPRLFLFIGAFADIDLEEL